MIVNKPGSMIDAAKRKLKGMYPTAPMPRMGKSVQLHKPENMNGGLAPKKIGVPNAY